MGCRSCGRGKRIAHAIPVQSDRTIGPSGQKMLSFLPQLLAALKGRRVMDVSIDDDIGLNILLSGGIVIRVPRDDAGGFGSATINAQLLTVETPNEGEFPFFDFQTMESEDENELTVGELQVLVNVIGKVR